MQSLLICYEDVNSTDRTSFDEIQKLLLEITSKQNNNKVDFIIRYQKEPFTWVKCSWNFKILSRNRVCNNLDLHLNNIFICNN